MRKPDIPQVLATFFDEAFTENGRIELTEEGYQRIKTRLHFRTSFSVDVSDIKIVHKSYLARKLVKEKERIDRRENKAYMKSAPLFNEVA